MSYQNQHSPKYSRRHEAQQHEAGYGLLVKGVAAIAIIGALGYGAHELQQHSFGNLLSHLQDGGQDTPDTPEQP